MSEAFERDGYVVLEGAFTAGEVADLKAEIRRVLGLAGSEPPAGVNPRELEAFHKHGVFVGLAVNSPVFRAAARKTKVVSALGEILGDHVVFLSDKIVRKDGETEFASPWHQDWPYWKGSHKVSVWIALDPANRDNGCLKIVPGSHRQGEMSHDGAAEDGLGFANRLDPARIDDRDVTAVELAAGSAVIFHDLLFHASYPNASGRERWALISTYKDGDAEDPAYSWASAAFTVRPAG